MCLELRDLRSLLRASVALCRSVRSTRSRCASNIAICDRSYVQAWLFVGACAARDQDVPRTSRSAIAPTCKRGSLQERAQHAIKMCLDHRDLRSLLRASAALCRSVRSTRSRCASNFAICDRSYVQALVFGACAARDRDVSRSSRSAISPTCKRWFSERAQHAIEMCLDHRDLRSLLPDSARFSVGACAARDPVREEPSDHPAIRDLWAPRC